MKLVIATTNAKKKKELQHLLEGLKIQVLTLADFKKVPRVRENGKTFEENAVKKAVKIANYTGLLTLADDSGLEVEALEGAPGIYSARFAGKSKSDLRNNQKLLKLMSGLPKPKRKARFVCAVAVAKKGKLLKVITGTVRGYISEGRRGESGFGYDPVFIPYGFNKTFAELGLKVKNKISHRAKALDRTKKYITKNLEKFSQNL